MDIPPEQKRRSPLLWGGLALFAIIFLLFAGIQLTDAYHLYFDHQGEKAYAAGNCELALKHFNRLPENRLDSGLYEVGSMYRLCTGYLEAVSDQEDGNYSAAFATYMSDSELYITSPLSESVQAEINALFVKAGPDELASAKACANLEEAWIPYPETNLPMLYHACGQVYIDQEDYSTALEWQRDFLLSYPNHELANTVEGELLDNPAVCDQAEALKYEGAIANRDGFMPTLYADCGQQYDDNDESERAFELYLALLTDYPNAPQANQAVEALLDNPAACDQFDALEANRTIANRDNLIPDLLYNCGGSSRSAGELSAAIGFYEQFLDGYPEDSRAAGVELTLAKMLLAQAEAAGAVKIATPNSTGFAALGTSLVIIQNDSPESLRIVFNGPETQIEKLERCVTCRIYTEVGPDLCPAEGPIGIYELLPGTYEVLIESSSDTGATPFTGTWELGDAREYYQCFIITTFE